MQLNGENSKTVSDNEIFIKSNNEVHIKIESNRGIAQELSDHFQFDVPGAKYKLNIIFEVKGETKPVCVAETLSLVYFGSEEKP